MCDSSGATSWAHDSAGRALTEKRTILGVTQTTSYAYNLDGSIAAVTYPSGKIVTYTVSNAQRLTAAKDVANNVQFATAASYAAPGGLSGMITGQISGGFSGITKSHTYNSSLEYTGTKATSTAGTAMDLSLNYNLSGGDNGTVTGITNNADNGRTQSFTYDPLNRISSATTQALSGVDCWGQSFTPDALANLNSIGVTQCSAGTLSVTVDANNHINSSTAFAYDAAGNMTKDGSGTGYLYTFDAENHLTLATGFAGGPYCYVYDGNGLRVAKKSAATTCSSGTVTKLYWRSITGDALAETDATGSTTNSAYSEYIFFAGRRIASRNGAGSIFYWFADQLGSTRTITTGSGPGQTPGQLCYDADFTPYGQEISYTARLQTTACPPSYKFTGYERDPETTAGATDTGLDYAFARYYSSRLGRFLSTDPLGGSVGDLQSHNAYAYTRNNPLNSIDPSGADDCLGGEKANCVSDWFGPGGGGFGMNLFGAEPLCDIIGCNNFWDGRAQIGFGGTTHQFDLLNIPIVVIKEGWIPWPNSGVIAPSIISGTGVLGDPTYYWGVISTEVGTGFNLIDLGWWGTFGRGNTSGSTVSPTPTLKFKPPSWENFTHEFLPCWGAQVTGNLLTGKGLVGTVAAVAATAKNPLVGGSLLLVWTGINAYKAGSDCAFASRAVYE